MARKRRAHETAGCLALASVILPVLVAQVGLASSDLLPPHVGWNIYVYGSLVSGVVATLLGGRALL